MAARNFWKALPVMERSLSEAKFTDVLPYGFKSVFEKSFIESALLLEEQSFYLNSNSRLGIKKIAPTMLFEETLPLEGKESKSNKEELENQVKLDSIWTEKIAAA